MIKCSKLRFFVTSFDQKRIAKAPRKLPAMRFVPCWTINALKLRKRGDIQKYAPLIN